MDLKAFLRVTALLVDAKGLARYRPSGLPNSAAACFGFQPLIRWCVLIGFCALGEPCAIIQYARFTFFHGRAHPIAGFIAV